MYDNAGYKGLKGISFQSQNVTTLNLSNYYNNQLSQTKLKKKLTSILSFSSDIIFLQDIRLSNKKHIFEEFIRCTKFGNYISISNSSLGVAGVAIIYKRELDIQLISTYRSPCEYFLIVHCKINGTEVILANIYGRKDSDDENFMQNVFNRVNSYGLPIIAGGDFNMVQCTKKPTNPKRCVHPSKQKYSGINPELFNMATVPNPKNSQKLEQILSAGLWVDPFRYLYPHKREFSHIPYTMNNRNRSRIDFFLVSSDLAGIITECSYSANKIKEFDHKSVFLNLGSINKSNLPKIDNYLLNVAGNWQVAVVTALELYLQHTVDAGDQLLQDRLQALIEVKYNITLLSAHMQGLEKRDLLVEVFLESLINDFDRKSDLFPNFDDLAQRNLNIPPQLFYETLVNNIRNDICSFQKMLRKSEKQLVSTLNIELMRLKSNPESFATDVYELEGRISDIFDNRVKIQCEKLEVWKVLNNEKPSKAFCSLTNSGNKRSDLTQIQKETNGTLAAFQSDKEREEYINSFFRDLYGAKDEVDMNIEDFLGNDIINSEYVQNKRLSVEESQLLDQPLSVIELDKSLKKCKKKSAPGADGWSYPSISFFWKILRSALLKSFNSMSENEKLEYSFSRVNLRMIPKKGDLKRIGNWRPISLLSCHYKIVSSAINRRLTKFSSKLLDCRQKAYSSDFVAQEALMIIKDNIYKAIQNNSNLAVCAVDFSKAFDLLKHSFIEKTLDFFNFGPYMKKLCRTILNGRVGSIIYNEKTQSSFSFECGSGQGDSVSASFFNLCQEILLICLSQSQLLERIEISTPIHNRQTTHYETLKHVSYADDLTDFISASRNNLKNLKIIFNNFYLLSGLRMNLAKTSIVPVAAARLNQDFCDAITEEGFILSNSFTVLGYKIDNQLKELRQNIKTILSKMERISSFWSKFSNITIFGRLALAKTYLISQLSYLSPILSFSQNDFNTFDNVIIDFIKKGSSFYRKDNITKPCHLGGLGMFRTRNFINGIKLGLFKRSLKNEDTWAQAIRNARFNPGNPFLINMNDSVLNLNPSSKLLATALTTFLPSFYKVDGNSLKSPILNNRNFFRDMQNFSCSLAGFCEQTVLHNSNVLVAMRAFDVANMNSGTALGKWSIERKLGIVLTDRDYNYIADILHHNQTFIRSKLDLKITSIDEFFEKHEKGSRHFRKVMEMEDTDFFSDGIKTKKQIMGTPGPIDYERSLLYLQWTKNSLLDNATKLRLLKFLCNGLQFNGQLYKHKEVNRYCYSCKRLSNSEPKESLSHLLNNCPKFFIYLQYIGRLTDTDANLMKDYFMFGYNTENTNFNILGNLVLCLFINLFMLLRNKSIDISFAFLSKHLSTRIHKMCLISSSFKRIILNSQSFKDCNLNNFEYIESNKSSLSPYISIIKLLNNEK